MLNLTPLLKAYAAWRFSLLNSQAPALAQERCLLGLAKRAAATKFGREHNFDSIRSVTDFQNRVPLRTYEQFWQEYLQPAYPLARNLTWPGLIPFYAVSSGTSSGTTKYIPYTHEMTASNTRAGMDLLCHHLRHRPKSRIFSGRCFMLGGTSDLVQHPEGVQSGDLSGIAVKTMRAWARPRYFPPLELTLIKNWEEKIEVFARESLKAEITMISGVPSWMLIFFKRLFELAAGSNGKLICAYPNLEMLVHGGVNFAPYRKQFEDLLDGSGAEMREVYPASEGFFGVADRGYGEGLRLVLDHGIFYEFVPLEELGSTAPTRHWVKNIEADINYALVISSCAGLWSYVVGDTVRFVDRDIPRVLITGRTSYYLSAFGEHLIEEEIEDAISTASVKIGLSVSDFSVGPVYPADTTDLGGHLYVVEFAPRQPGQQELEVFSAALDKRLCERNEDYEAHRAKGFGLKAPIVTMAPSGMFAAWMKSRGKLGGQNKVPRIITKQELFDDLVNFNRRFKSDVRSFSNSSEKHP